MLTERPTGIDSFIKEQISAALTLLQKRSERELGNLYED
jgi:hypothetical protein